MKKAEKARPTLVYERGQIKPASDFDGELFEAYKDGTQFIATPRTGRNPKQLSLYWKVLTEVVEATDQWPTPTHLHKAVKLALGYVDVFKALDGIYRISLDSVALNEMDDADFDAYFERAMAKLSEELGTDVLASYEEWKASHNAT